jgi:protein-S-isoprenylcysteine O-methyltransferase Ste14
MIPIWIGRTTFLLGLIIFIAIRVPHERRSRSGAIAESRKGPLERMLLALMMTGVFVLPALAIFTPLLAFAEYPLHPGAYAAGVMFLLATFWLFHRSHVDLGTNWSVSLELREDHRLITRGVYRRIRHPMYAAIFLYGFAQALLLPNWIAGPACLVAFTVMFAARLGPEERMMLDRFGGEYARYMAATKRLVPWVW